MIDKPTSIDLHIARRVSVLRKEEGLTLEDLASRSGVSRSMVSLVERGESSPTANVLDKLASGLGVTMATLFSEGKSPDANPVSVRAKQQVWRDPATGYVRRNLSPAGFPSPIELVEVTLPPLTQVAYDSAFRIAPYHQQIWVLEGTIEMQIGSEQKTIAKGDCFAMLVEGPISFRNPGKRKSRHLVALAPTSRNRAN
jgi:transcriptional regulator with XRE-family HTH domain